MNELEKERQIIDEIDREMARLFEKRSEAVKKIALYKQKNHLEIFDKSRENLIIKKNSEYVSDRSAKDYYPEFMENVISISKKMQKRIINSGKTAKTVSDSSIYREIPVELGENSYKITLKRHILSKADEYIDLSRKVMIITDSKVPYSYSETLALQCYEPHVLVIPDGEDTKSITQYTYISKMLLEYGFTRSDCVVALGGGVVGDIAGFAASTYMRGIDFYNIPTTFLSQVDSSIGGKVALNFCGVKNIIGAFYQPKHVLIDPELLETLPERQLKNGLAESLKIAITSDKELYSMFKDGSYIKDLDRVIERSLILKKNIVEQDEKESSIRRVLNFGHTLGHALEVSSKGKLLHGEAVGIGMIPMCSESVRNEITSTLLSMGLPCKTDISFDKAKPFILHDKKAEGSYINAVFVNEIGKCEVKLMPLDEYLEYLKPIYPYEPDNKPKGKYYI